MPNIEPIHLPFFANLLFLLVVARLLGEIFEYFRQPAMIGEILAGIILGPTLFNVCHYNSELKVFSEMAVFLLVIMAGLEINPTEILKLLRSKKIIIGLMGFFIPISSGIIIGKIFGLDNIVSLFLGLCISITALPVSIRILVDLKKLNTEIGKNIISVAIFNDVLALMILGVLIDTNKDTQNYFDILYSVGETVTKVGVFILVVVLFYQLLNYLTKRAETLKDRMKKGTEFLRGKDSIFAFVFCFILLFANISESAGLHFVLGAFFGAMLITKELIGKDQFKNLEKTTKSITMGFLAPIFFAVIGLEFHMGSIDNIPLLVAVLVVSFATKIFGGYLGARIAGMDNPTSLTIGFGLNARGVMELVIANIALQAKIIDLPLFSILVLMGILTTLSTPILLKKGFAMVEKKEIINPD